MADRGVHAAGAKPKVIIVTGPTAVGKTKIGLELAKRLGGEVISADSVQVHTGLDVGSDKLPESQRQGVRHHLIDVLPPTAEFSAGEFYELGRRATEDILSRGKVPIVVGGTGFYLRWYMYGKAQTPQSSPELQHKVAALVQQAWAKASEAAAAEAEAAAAAAEAAAAAADAAAGSERPAEAGAGDSGGDEAGCSGSQDGGERQRSVHRREWRKQCRERRRAARAAAPPTPQQLADRNMPPDPPANLSHEQLWEAAVTVIAELGDPEAAARVGAERHNWYRLQRVCQILMQNGGRPLSEMDVDTQKEPDYDFRCFFLHRPRKQLYDKIAYRVEEMVAGGLLREAREMMALGMTAGSCNAARAIGYRQALEFMEEARRQGGAATPDALKQTILKIGAATRKLVKSQHTWFRDDVVFRWVDNDAPEEEVLALITAELDKPQHEGGCGDSGRLDKEVAREMREYTQPIVIFRDPAAVERALQEVRELLADGGGGGGGGGGGLGDAAEGGPVPAAQGTEAAHPS